MIYEQQIFSEALRAAAVLPDDSLILVVGDDNDCVLLNVQTGQEQRRLQGHSAWCTRAVVSSVKPWVIATGGHDNTVRLWNISSEKPVGVLKHSATIQVICFHPDGDLLLTVDQDSICTLWSVREGTIAGIYPLEGRILSGKFRDDQVALVNEASELTVLSVHKGVQNGVLI